MSTNQEQVSMAISESTDGTDLSTNGSYPDLDAALAKLAAGSFDPASLPNARSSDIWGRIENVYNLTLGELSALQNKACSDRPRGILPRVRDATMYKIHDERIRAQFTISSGHYTMLAQLLVDSGASTELKLPARKVLQLGLVRRHGPRKISRSSTNNVKEMLTFSAVLVKATFNRDGAEGTVEADLAVKCEKDEYDILVASEASTSNQGGDPFTTPTTGQDETNFADSDAAVSNSNPIREIRLSPVRHRPNNAPLEQAVIGTNGLKKLGLHLNCELQQLEIEEDEVLDDDSQW